MMDKSKIRFKVTKPKPLSEILARIGEGLSELRMQKGYASVKDFANDHKLPMIQYWRIEKGKANLTLKSLVKLLAIHRLAIEDFFCWLRDVNR
jgi:hypothetical protein